MSWYANSHSRQFSLLSSARWEMNTSQGQGEVACTWEGITPALYHRLCGISTEGLNGLRKGDKEYGTITSTVSN